MTRVPAAWIRGPGLKIYDDQQLPVAQAYSEPVARLIEAAPEMAGILLRHVRPDVYSERTAQRDLHADTVAILVKAGVLEPLAWDPGSPT